MSPADRSGDFGSRLREARERKGVSLRQIANQTKISVTALEALERNNISRLPGGIFSRAFVRSYAIEVGLDPEATIQDFIAQFPHDSVTAGHPNSDAGDENETLESDRRVATTVLWILAVSIPLAGAVLYYSIGGRPAPAEEAPLPAAAPVVREAPSAPIAAPVPDPPTAPSVAEAAPVAVPVPPTSPPATDVLTVGLTARRPVWVSATVDGQKAIERLLQAGEQQTMEVKREMVLTAGDASALSVALNGAEARALGKSGEVVTARLNLNNYKEYLRPR